MTNQNQDSKDLRLKLEQIYWLSKRGNWSEERTTTKVMSLLEAEGYGKLSDTEVFMNGAHKKFIPIQAKEK